MLATEIVSFPYTFQVLRIDLKIDQSERAGYCLRQIHNLVYHPRWLPLA